MTRNTGVTFSIVILCVALAGVFSCRQTPANNAPPSTAAPRMTTPVMDRVLKSGTIRASYAVAAPLCMKDPNTGQLSGVGVDILNEAGRRLSLKVAWVEETGWGALFEGLNTDRY